MRYDRRTAIQSMIFGAAMTLVPRGLVSKTNSSIRRSFSYCLNTSTISGQKLGIQREIEIAAMAGYDGVEIWIPSLQRYLDEGGHILDLRKRIVDLGIQVENAIGFAKWIVDDPNTRSQAHEQLKSEMDLLRTLGCQRIAAPPFGATEEPGLNLDLAAKRYHDIVELGIQHGVIPQLEVWGFSANLHKMSQALYVLAEAGHAKGRILPDVYHMHRGGSKVDALAAVSTGVIDIFHINDFPDEVAASELTDADRVYPGDGVANMSSILQYLSASEGQIVLSLELFNRTYWEQDPMEVAKTGLTKMKQTVAEAL